MVQYKCIRDHQFIFTFTVKFVIFSFILDLRYNFDIVKEQVNSYGEPYDFNSIMHYPFNAFAIDKRRNTIFPKDNRILGTARPYRGLSEIDVRQTRKMYQCDSKYLSITIRFSFRSIHTDNHQWRIYNPY